MGWEQDRNDEVVEAYGAGRPVAELEREYGMSQEQIERLVAGGPVKASRPGLTSTGNRVLLGVALGFVVQIFAGLAGAEFGVRIAVWIVVAVVTYALVAALVVPRR